MNTQPAGQPDEWAEVVHITTLPPPNDGKILFWARRNRQGEGIPNPILPNKAQDTWLWDKRTPNALQTVTVPNDPQGTEDIFCAGHTFLPDGRLVVGGGTDMVQVIMGPVPPYSVPAGTRTSFVFDNQAAPNTSWIEIGPMDKSRFYPSFIRLEDGRLFAAGHTGAEPVTQIPKAAEVREVLDATLTWSSADNASAGSNPFAPDCSDPAPLYAYDPYPRLHMLRDGSIFEINSVLSLFDRGVCPTSADPDRIVSWTSATQSAVRLGNSAHVLYFDENDVRREVIYSIGGHEEDGCELSGYSADVLKMVDPGPGKDWNIPDDPPNLAIERNTSTTIILLDGSFLVVGGARYDANPAVQTCVPVYTPELYKPPELFAAAGAGWQLMAPQVSSRTYHSAATLLEDGSVVSMGGVGQGPFSWQDNWTDVEVFEPPYMFPQVHRRPVIDTVNGSTTPVVVRYGEDITLQSRLFSGSRGEFRVALLAPCTGTHAVDFNQRYIELRTVGFAPNASGVSLTVEAPEDGFVAPPGWYMLTVVNAWGLPSEARWVKVLP